MNWNKLTSKHYFTEPVEYIHAINIFDSLEYDKLYENQNNLNHEVWQEFDKKYKTGFEFKEDITNIDLNKEIIALWFFKERSDNTSSPDINIAGRILTYFPNAFILTKSKDISIVDNKKRKYIRRPFVQLDISEKTFEAICKNIKKN